jgi:hypothetical protein
MLTLHLVTLQIVRVRDWLSDVRGLGEELLLFSEAGFLYKERADLRLPKQVSSGIVPATLLHHLTRHKQTKKHGSNHSPHSTHTYKIPKKHVLGVNLFIRLLHSKKYIYIYIYI